jgi:histidinol phosphatase-like PHP family hydrolase
MAGLAHAPLLCELHAHTTWSDGSQTIGQLVDSYGQAGFDVLCITDHVVRTDDPTSESQLAPEHVHARNHSAYVMAIEIEAARARVQYDMLVLPGLELTYNDPDPVRAAHAVAVGLESFVGSTTASNARSATRDARGQR